MSTGIKGQIDDAAFLYSNGRYLGSLSILVLAVAASSRRAFPRGTRSIKWPTKEMGDREAFTGFLGGRIHRLLFSDDTDRYGSSDLPLIRLEGKELSFEEVVYKYYRNALVHEGGLPVEVEFIEKNPNPQLTLGIRGAQLGASLIGDRFILDHGLLPILAEVVTGADCNAELYGRHIDRLTPRDGVNEAAFQARVLAEFRTSQGRYSMMKDVLFVLRPEKIQVESDSELQRRFRELSSAPHSLIHCVALSTHGLADYDCNLLPAGIAMLRLMAANYEIVRVV